MTREEWVLAYREARTAQKLGDHRLLTMAREVVQAKYRRGPRYAKDFLSWLPHDIRYRRWVTLQIRRGKYKCHGDYGELCESGCRRCQRKQSA